MPAANGIHEKWPDADPFDEVSVDPGHLEQDLLLAQRAVVIHQGEPWPTGVFCRNCHGRWPCQLYRWGHLVLWLAGWREADITDLVRQAEAGEVPWT